MPPRPLEQSPALRPVLIVCPANLTFQWQRELREKFDEKFLVLKGGDIREQFGANQWLEQKQVITSLDLAKRTDILPGLRQVSWDLTIVDEAHRTSAYDAEHKTQRYRLGELLRDTSDHFLMLTATPHRGDPDNFAFFRQLLDVSHCHTEPRLEEPIADPARLGWHEVTKVDHYCLSVDAMTEPMQLDDDQPRYG